MKHSMALILIALAMVCAIAVSPAGAMLRLESGAPSAAPETSAAESTPAAPWSADLTRVMAAYTKAIGGREVLSKIKNQVAVYTSSVQGRTLVVTTTSKAPYYFLQVTQVEGTAYKISVGFDGTTAWLQSASGAVAVLTGEDRAEVVSDAAGANDSEIFSDRWPTTVTLKPSETMSGKSYVVITIAPKDGLSHDLFLDPHTFRPPVERVVTSKSTSTSVVEQFGQGPLGELQAEVVTTTRSDGTPAITSTLRSVHDNTDVSDLIFTPPLGKGTETI